MFGNKKRKSEYAEIYCNTQTIKQVFIKGAIVTFEFAPHPQPGKLIRSASLYISSLGVVILPSVVDGNLEVGIPKADYRAEAEKILKAAELVIGLKYSPEMSDIAVEMLAKGLNLDQIEAYINSLLRRSLAQRGIVIQSSTGYKPSELIAGMSPHVRNEIKKELGESTPPPPPPAEEKTADRKKYN